MSILLLHPPAAKPGEPPLGMAVLLGFLRSRGIAAEAVDANLEAFLYLLDTHRLRQIAGPSPSRVVHRALKHTAASLQRLRSCKITENFARYQTAVHHLNHALEVYAGTDKSERLTLSDYTHAGLSEFSPDDLERVARGEVTTLFDDYLREDLLPRILRQKPTLIALSVNYRHQVLPAFALAGLLRRYFPQIPLIGGGGMFSSWRSLLLEKSLRFSAFSHIVFGPGEASLAKLATGLSAPSYYLEDTDKIAFAPDFSFVPVNRYLSPLPILPVSSSRGCYWRRCLFCPEAASPTHPYSIGAPSVFPALLKQLAERYQVRHFHLTDNAVPTATLHQLAHSPKELAGLSWHGFVRFEKELLDFGWVEKLTENGCRMLQLGVESGSQSMLDRLQKGTHLNDIAKILQNMKRAGIRTYVYIMLGVPGETEGDAEATLHFLETHADLIDYLNPAIMNLPRESQLLNEPHNAGIASYAPLDEAAPLGLYRSFIATSGWGRAEARQFMQQRLLSSPAIRKIVQRTPPAFTSNHAFLFNR